MRWGALLIAVLIAVSTAGCDAVLDASGSCLFNSCGCASSSSGYQFTDTGGDPAEQNVTVRVGDVYTYDLRSYVYVYSAYGRDCEPDRSVRRPFRVTDVSNSDSSAVEVSTADGILQLSGVSQGVAQIRVGLRASGLYEFSDGDEFRLLTVNVTVSE